MRPNLKTLVAVLVSLIDDLLIAVVLLWLLPRLRVKIPLPLFITILAVWMTYAVLTFRFGRRILNREPLKGFSSMIGTEGYATSPLAPEGTVKIMGELWRAKGKDGNIEAGSRVYVVGQEGLKLVVSKKRV